MIERIIVGLGNPEPEYKGTRHNAGFEVVNRLAEEYKIQVKKSKHRALIGEGHIAGHQVVLVKPQTYMNLSGESVRAVLSFYKREISDLIVVYDDISLAVGAVRARESGGAGGHNGMKDILEKLDTNAFTRVRIGIGDKPPGWDLADYVLSRFSPGEQEAVKDGIIKAAEAVVCILSEGTAAAMNKYNSSTRPANDEKCKLT